MSTIPNETKRYLQSNRVYLSNDVYQLLLSEYKNDIMAAIVGLVDETVDSEPNVQDHVVTLEKAKNFMQKF